MSLHEALEAAEYPVFAARNGNEALHMLVEGREEAPGLIVLDLVMPGMTGWEFLVILRSYVRLAHIPVIVVSGCAPAPGDLERGRVAAWLQKPFRLAELIAVIERSQRC